MASAEPGERWLPHGFAHPARVALESGHHLRPIRESDVDLDYPAVMGSQPRLWQRYGKVWGWPPPMMTLEQDRADLARHEREMVTGESFNYAAFDPAESSLLGCVYIDPPEPTTPGCDALISWWVTDPMVGSALERALADFVPRWAVTDWPFRAPRFHP